MSNYIAALPMYDWPETRAATDAEWDRFRSFCQSAGIDAPESLVRRNGDLPPVRGGIRDGEGRVIAPDPSALPPDAFDFQAAWRHPRLLLAQTCWGPLEHGLAEHVIVVGQPSYNGIEGGEGEFYSSAILMRGEGNVPAPADGTPRLPLGLLRGARLAYNGPDSMSGMLALERDLKAEGESLSIFSERLESGAHRQSIVEVASGRADVCAVDCRSWKLAQRHEPRAQELQVVGWTGRRKGLPMITSIHTPADVVEKLRKILAPH